MNWYTPCAYNDAQKRSFHATGRKRLKALATALGLEAGSFDVRSNLGGIAVSGEVTLHGEHLYVQICQPATGCGQRHPHPHLPGPQGLHRRPPTTFAPLSWLDDQTEALVGHCRAILDREEAGHETPHQRNPRQAHRQWTRTGQGQRHQGRKRLSARRQALLPGRNTRPGF